MYISGFYWTESSPVTSHLVNGYICRAISAFCENLTSHSFAVPDYQSKKPKFTTLFTTTLVIQPFACWSTFSEALIL